MVYGIPFVWYRGYPPPPLSNSTRVCSGESPILSLNNKCSADYYRYIIPHNGYSKENPFKYKVNNIEGLYVKSQIEYDN